MKIYLVDEPTIASNKRICDYLIDGAVDDPAAAALWEGYRYALSDIERGALAVRGFITDEELRAIRNATQG